MRKTNIHSPTKAGKWFKFTFIFTSTSHFQVFLKTNI